MKLKNGLQILKNNTNSFLTSIHYINCGFFILIASFTKNTKFIAISFYIFIVYSMFFLFVYLPNKHKTELINIDNNYKKNPNSTTRNSTEF